MVPRRENRGEKETEDELASPSPFPFHKVIRESVGSAAGQQLQASVRDRERKIEKGRERERGEERRKRWGREKRRGRKGYKRKIRAGN
jgi:hypothetical protein